MQSAEIQAMLKNGSAAEKLYYKIQKSFRYSKEF